MSTKISVFIILGILLQRICFKLVCLWSRLGCFWDIGVWIALKYMQEFKIYLIKKKLIDKSIKRVIDITHKYLDWLEDKNLKIEDSRYSDFMNYIGHLQARATRTKYVKSCSNLKNDNARSGCQRDSGVVRLKTSTINDYIRCIGHYYDFRKLDNVTVGVRLLGETRSKCHLFNEEKLDKIYSLLGVWPNISETHLLKKGKTDYQDTLRKIILGLIIYQGLDRNEAFKLKIDDLDLSKGKISIGSSIRKNDRVLDLKSHQILLFYDYIKENDLNEQLFPSFGKENRIRKLLEKLLLDLKKQSSDIINLRQLRYSCYAVWIKRFDIRKAQYFAGFKKPSSIQKYQNLDLEDLKGDISRFHPLE